MLDERGLKMSKSIGNVVDPRTVMLGGVDQKAEPPYGADVLRLWVASVDSIGSDVSIGPQILEQVPSSLIGYTGSGGMVLVPSLLMVLSC